MQGLPHILETFYFLFSDGAAEFCLLLSFDSYGHKTNALSCLSLCAVSRGSTTHLPRCLAGGHRIRVEDSNSRSPASHESTTSGTYLRTLSTFIADRYYLRLTGRKPQCKSGDGFIIMLCMHHSLHNVHNGRYLRGRAILMLATPSMTV